MSAATTRSELARREALIIDLEQGGLWEDRLERTRILNELRVIERETVEPLLDRADHVPWQDGRTNLRKEWDRGLLMLTEVLDAVEAHDRELAEAAATLCREHEAGACFEGCPDAYAEDGVGGILARQHEEDFIIELDACGDLETLISTPAKAWVRMTSESGPGSGWPVVEVRGTRADVRDFVGLHWGDDMLADLCDAGEL